MTSSFSLSPASFNGLRVRLVIALRDVAAAVPGRENTVPIGEVGELRPFPIALPAPDDWRAYLGEGCPHFIDKMRTT